MAIERWFAIARPTTYKFVFKRSRAVAYALTLLIFSAITNANVLIDIKLSVKSSIPSCEFYSTFDSKRTSQIFTILYCIVTVFLPLLVTTATYFHLRFFIRGQQGSDNSRTRQLEIKLTRMSAVVALCLAFCFIPNQISYILTKFDVYKYNTPQSLVTVVLAMCNSCINPWVYFCTNRTYRQEFIRFLCPRKMNEVGNYNLQVVTSTDVAK